MENKDDVNICLCKNCGCCTLYVNEDEKKLLKEFEKTDVIKKVVNDSLANSGADAMRDVRSEYDEKYGNLITAKVVKFGYGKPSSFRNYYERGCSTDYSGKKYDIAVNVELTKNTDSGMQFVLLEDSDFSKCHLCESDDIENISLPIMDGHFKQWRDEKWDKINNILESIPKKLMEIYQNKKEVFVKNNMDIKSSENYNVDNIIPQELLLNLINVEKNINFLEEELGLLYKKEMEQRKLFSSVVSDIKDNNTNQNLNILQKPEEPIKPEEPELKKVGFFTKRSDNEYNEELLKDYELKNQEYNEELEKYKNDLEIYEKEKQEQDNQNKKNKEELSNKIKKILDFANENKEWKLDGDIIISETLKEKYDLAKDGYIFLEDNIEEVKQNLIELYKLKNDMLSLNIIFPKYNNLIAWTTMYEYFTTGRVDSLTGPNGAYNLYESEVRANLIIMQLDSISDKLDTIKDNQFMLYTVMEDINNNLHLLNSKMDVELTLSAITAFNTTKTAYYTKLTAEKTNAIAWLTTLK